MDLPVTPRTECNQIFLHVTAQQTARLYMMDMKFAGATTILATPPVSLQYFFVQGAGKPLVQVENVDAFQPSYVFPQPRTGF